MCGRYVAASDPAEIADYFQIDEVKADELPPSWNVAPTMEVYSVAESREAPGERRLGSMRWGLVPSWAKDPSIGSRLINARADSVDSKPAFRNALERRRCLIPADGFYEWHRRDDGVKQPYLVRRVDGEMMAFAGLWEAWRDAEGEWLRTCAIVTTDATGTLAGIHDRCPVILTRDHWDLWLDRSVQDAGAVTPVLAPNAPDLLEVVAVSTRVNDVRNDDESLVEPCEPAASEPTLFELGR